MADSNQETPTDDDPTLLREKRVAWYSALVSAFVDSSIERDKSLLTLSSGGIAILITIMTTVGLASLRDLILLIVAAVAFLIAIFLLLIIFNMNKKYLIKLANDDKTQKPPLKIFDRIVFACFIIGIVSALLVGISSSINQLQKKTESTTTANKEEKTESIKNDTDTKTTEHGALTTTKVDSSTKKIRKTIILKEMKKTKP